MKASKLLIALVGGLAMPLGMSIAQAGALADPVPPPGYDVTPLDQKIQYEQMAGMGMRTGAEGSPGMTMFERLDSDKDGYISRSEADQSTSVRQDFNKLDQDLDTRISHEEWKAGGGM